MIKRFVEIALLTLALTVATSCHRPIPRVSAPAVSPSLAAIDTMMWKQPDSAFRMLLDFADSPSADSLDTYNGHYLQLLIAELLYKNYFEQTNRNELLRAVDYFDTLVVQGGTPAQTFLDARAHYINGVGFYERDSVVEACQEYLKALEVMEGHFLEAEQTGHKALFLAYANMHLTELFSDCYFHKEAIYFGKRALTYCCIYNTEPWYFAWLYDEIGLHYDILGDFDSAGYYYNKGMEYVNDKNSLSYRDLACHLAYLSYKKGGPYESSLTSLYGLLAQSESEKERLARSLVIGDIFYQESIMDSVVVYLDEVYKHESNTDAKLFAAQRLQEIYLSKGDTALANEYALFCAHCANTTNHYGEFDSQLAELFRVYRQNEEKDRHWRQMQKIRGGVAAFSILLAVIVTVIIALLAIQKKRQKRWMEQKENQHSANLERLEQEKRMLSERLQQIDEEQAKVQLAEFEALMNERICVDIKQRLKIAGKLSSFDVKDYPNFALSSKEETQLFQIIDKHCGDFSRKLKRLFPSLSTKDIQLCRYYLLDLTVLQVAILKHIDYSSIRKRSSNLKTKLDCEELHLRLKSSLFDITEDSHSDSV